MKKSKLLAGLALSALCMAAFAAKDPVIMKVAGVDVPLSEFEYLYNKNSNQQVEKLPLSEYVEVFKLYKQKVADAIAEGKDTTAQFRREYEQYRHELALPYLTDSVYIESLAKEEYDRMGTEAEAIHIMRFKTPNKDDNRASITLLDSIKGLLDAGASFSDMAKTYSQDKGSLDKGGRIGFIPAGKFPYAFESAVFAIPEGEVSKVVESPMGYHLIKGGKKRPARGKASVSHILKLVQPQKPGVLSLEATQELEAKHLIDSIYSEAKANPGKFASLAQLYSDDKQTGRSGGILPPFGATEMVEEFDSVAFSLQPGEISRPFRSPYGWHIIKMQEIIPVPSYQEERPRLISIVTNLRDDRGRMVLDHQRELLQKRFKGKYNSENLSPIYNSIAEGGIDSVFVAAYTDPSRIDAPLYTYSGKNTVTMRDVAPILQGLTVKDPEFARSEFDTRLNAAIYSSMIRHRENELMDEVPAYRNLLNEFHDGSLLYEVGKDKVWDRSAKDTEGLEAYFNTHKADYKWTAPKVKGLLIQTVSDSVSNEIRKRAEGLGAEEVVALVRKEFSNEAKAERILVEKGKNPMVDFVAFGGEAVQPSSSKYKDFFLYNFKVLDAPEEAADVKALVTNDYQAFLEKEWEDDLRSKYPVEVYEKVLKKVKERK